MWQMKLAMHTAPSRAMISLAFVAGVTFSCCPADQIEWNEFLPPLSARPACSSLIKQFSSISVSD